MVALFAIESMQLWTRARKQKHMAAHSTTTSRQPPSARPIARPGPASCAATEPPVASTPTPGGSGVGGGDGEGGGGLGDGGGGLGEGGEGEGGGGRGLGESGVE